VQSQPLSRPDWQYPFNTVDPTAQHQFQFGYGAEKKADMRLNTLFGSLLIKTAHFCPAWHARSKAQYSPAHLVMYQLKKH